MNTKDKEKIKQTIRDRYGKVAQSGTAAYALGQPTSCCGESCSSAETIPTTCGYNGASISDKQLSSIIGYSKEDVDGAPEGANLGLGCGNPVALASLKPGQIVVDLGSGGGFDCFLAAKQVGKTGHVIGVDMTPDMIRKARENAQKSGSSNVEFRLGEIEHLPVANDSVDVIMSNCVINLSPEKLDIYRDAYRVLKPGGQLVISDIIALAPLDEDVQKDLELVSACVGGAATIEETEKMLKYAGFTDIKITPNEGSREFIRKCAPDSNVADCVVSAYIEAAKP